MRKYQIKKTERGEGGVRVEKERKTKQSLDKNNNYRTNGMGRIGEIGKFYQEIVLAVARFNLTYKTQISHTV